MQVELPDMSEDCLYLNVFAPGKAAPGTNLPVGVICRIAVTVAVACFTNPIQICPHAESFHILRPFRHLWVMCSFNDGANNVYYIYYIFAFHVCMYCFCIHIDIAGLLLVLCIRIYCLCLFFMYFMSFLVTCENTNIYLKPAIRHNIKTCQWF